MLCDDLAAVDARFLRTVLDSDPESRHHAFILATVFQRLTRQIAASQRYSLHDDLTAVLMQRVSMPHAQLLPLIADMRLPHRQCWFEWHRERLPDERFDDNVGMSRRIGMLCHQETDDLTVALAWSMYETRVPQISPLMLYWSAQPTSNGFTEDVLQRYDPTERAAVQQLAKRQEYKTFPLFYHAYPPRLRPAFLKSLEYYPADHDWVGEWKFLLLLLHALHQEQLAVQEIKPDRGLSHRLLKLR